MRVVLYLRYSSDKQTEQSIEGQSRICTAFCKQQGYEIVGRYVDRATSAFKDTDKRTEFLRMVRDSEKRLWDGVVVYRLDRFARNQYDFAIYERKLNKNGVSVISATENISETADGVILKAVLRGMAEYYSLELSQKITRGMEDTAKKAHSVGGSIPLGYKIENKKYVIDEPAAQIVREAFEMYAAGTPLTDICEEFNGKGYRTSKGAEFNKNSFHSVLKNEKYIGTYKYKDIRIENAIPAIINKETFDAVQKRMTKNKKAPARTRANVNYLLSGKLFCGHCGSPMLGDSGTSKTGAVYNYYTCGKRKKERLCKKRSIKKEYIERIVVQDALTLLTPELIDELADIAVKESIREVEENSVIPSLRNNVNEIQKSIDNLLKMVERGADSDSLVDRLNTLEKQKRAAEKRLVTAQDDYVVLDKDQVVWWLSKFVEGDIKDENFCQGLIDLFINSVTVWDEPDGYYKITSVYNLTQNNIKTFTSSDINGGGSPNAVKSELFCYIFINGTFGVVIYR